MEGILCIDSKWKKNQKHKKYQKIRNFEFDKAANKNLHKDFKDT